MISVFDIVESIARKGENAAAFSPLFLNLLKSSLFQALNNSGLYGKVTV